MWTSNGKNGWTSDDGWYDVHLPTTGAWANGFNFYGQSQKVIRFAMRNDFVFCVPPHPMRCETIEHMRCIAASGPMA